MLQTLAWRGFGLVFGLTNFIIMLGLAAFRDRAFTKRRKMDEEEKRELAAASKKYWSLTTSPLQGFKHKFFATEKGIKHHYVVNAAGERKESKNVAIFVHGFADSYVLWDRILTSPTLASYALIAVDLPGYGGSDSLPNYGPSQMLEAMTEFIIGMREEYLGDKGRLVMVTHDWGSVIGGRLASEAEKLADRWIITSVCLPALWAHNARHLLSSSKLMLRTYLRQPFNFRLLRSAYQTVTPIKSQVMRSFYIFILNLPRPIPTFFVTMGNFWFLRLLHLVQAGTLRNGKLTRELTPKESAHFLAASSGPSISQFEANTTTVDGIGYSESVRKRCADHGMSEKIRLYRENLAYGTWEKSLETAVRLNNITSAPRAGSGTGLFDDGPEGSVKAPATYIMGGKDVAFDRKLTMDGFSDYLPKRSQAIVVEEAQHWMPSEQLGRDVIQSAVLWALEGEQGDVVDHIRGTGAEIKVVADKQ